MPAWVTSAVHAKAIDALIAARRDAGLTQRDVAQRIGKPQSFVAKIETRERNLSLLEFLGLARAIGVAPDELLGRVARDLPDRFEF
jgi:transcriptional regulator with XRE-family HTH domain